MATAASDAIGGEFATQGDENALNWVAGAGQPAQGRPVKASAEQPGRDDPNSEVNVTHTFCANGAEQPARGDPNSEVSLEQTFTATIVSATSGEHMMSTADVGLQLTVWSLKRLLPNVVVNSSTEVAPTRMRFYRDSVELGDNDTVALQSHQASQITLKAIVDPRLCACGNQPDVNQVCMCHYCHFGMCGSCCDDHGERFCGHCDKFCCGHCLQKQHITHGWSSCDRNCSEWICHECVENKTPCK